MCFIAQKPNQGQDMQINPQLEVLYMLHQLHFNQI